MGDMCVYVCVNSRRRGGRGDVCMYVYVCVYMYVCMCVCMCVCVYDCVTYYMIVCE
jgi:hypothetical protein